jgi:hypothetical protein
MAQETLIEESGMPYSIVRATQFFEFAKGIADYPGQSGASPSSAESCNHVTWAHCPFSRLKILSESPASTGSM